VWVAFIREDSLSIVAFENGKGKIAKASLDICLNLAEPSALVTSSTFACIFSFSHVSDSACKEMKPLKRKNSTASNMFEHSNMLKLSGCSTNMYVRVKATSNMFEVHAGHASIKRVAAPAVQ
jgi:hypothetical protein